MEIRPHHRGRTQAAQQSRRVPDAGLAGCITYIGETNDLARRMREHIRSGKLPTGQGCGSTLEYMVADGRSTSRTRREHEQQSIEKHHPTLNRSKGGEGRPAGK